MYTTASFISRPRFAVETRHSSRRVAKSKSARPPSRPSSSSPPPAAADPRVAALPFSELFFHKSSAGSGWGEKSRKREGKGCPSVCHTHSATDLGYIYIYIGDDNTTTRDGKDTGKRRRNKEMRDTFLWSVAGRGSILAFIRRRRLTASGCCERERLPRFPGRPLREENGFR